MFKRDSKLFLRCLASALILFLLLGAVCVLAAGVVIRRSSQVYTPLRVAVIDHEDSVFSRILIGMAAGDEAVSDLLSAEIMSEEDAMEAFLRGEAAAVVELPKGFLTDVTTGAQGEGTIFLSDAVQRHADVVRSVAKFGERLLLAGQAGVFAGEALLREAGETGDMDAYLNRSNTALLEEALNAGERYFTVETLDYLDTGMSSSAYYGMCWLVFLLFLTSLMFVPLFTRDAEISVLRRLRSHGVGNVRFMAWKLFWPALFRFLLAIGVLILLGDWIGIDITVSGIVSIIAVVSFITVCGTALTVTPGDGVTVNVLFGFGGLFLAGGLVPRQVLPGWVTSLGDLTPFGTALSILKPAFGGEFSPWGSILGIFYAVLALWLMGRRLNRLVRGEASA